MPTHLSVRASNRRTAYTLVELVVSISVTGILMAGLTSTLYVASRGVSVEGPSRATLAGSSAAQDVLGDLQQAITFTERTATAATFTVADRNGDTFPDTIRYAWSGTPGDPLTRQYNGGPTVTVAEDVHHFNLDYFVRPVTTTTYSIVESAETVFAQYSSAVGGELKVDTSKWRGQYIHPSVFINPLPPETLTWKVTRVEVYARQGGAKLDAQFWVQLRRADANKKPTSQVLTSVLAYESDLPAAQTWVSYEFGSPADSWATEGVCLVLQGKEGGHIDVLTNDADSGYLYTSDSGTIWTYYSNQSLASRFYGTYTYESSTDNTRYYNTGVEFQLQVGLDVSARIDSAVNVLNEPEVTGP